jgi:sugar phosphate isomerase/epimerase
MVNIPAVIRALKGHRYDGWLVLEQDTTPGNPTEIAREKPRLPGKTFAVRNLTG